MLYLYSRILLCFNSFHTICLCCSSDQLMIFFHSSLIYHRTYLSSDLDPLLARCCVAADPAAAGVEDLTFGPLAWGVAPLGVEKPKERFLSSDLEGNVRAGITVSSSESSSSSSSSSLSPLWTGLPLTLAERLLLFKGRGGLRPRAGAFFTVAWRGVCGKKPY